ncbi:bifunctional nuclease family protein [Natranaeroarchaeum sulfidigenes]|uniref:Bifunctional nuclease n=1 Tax=Natranaeroarchaeum sulfidigenes TaxID=2784880 RepID=A0A897MSW7_9EURY|nr:bifunctional nuclease family protein [Natranaeroarchaeum sulfidigenes]QSG03587.1 Bifunctional nuclease [Natranaeroarchaeum sulfidigenes]
MKASIDAVRVAGTREGPVAVVVLTVEDESDVLPIFIGFEEAASIARGIDAEDIGRPLTHDLLLDVVEELGGRVRHVEVSAVEDGTYIADLHIDTPRGETTIDARPSDSLALASRTSASIEVSPDVFANGSRPAEEFEELDPLQDVAQLA